MTSLKLSAALPPTLKEHSLDLAGRALLDKRSSQLALLVYAEFCHDVLMPLRDSLLEQASCVRRWRALDRRHEPRGTRVPRGTDQHAYLISSRRLGGKSTTLGVAFGDRWIMLEHFG